MWYLLAIEKRKAQSSSEKAEVISNSPSIINLSSNQSNQIKTIKCAQVKRKAEGGGSSCRSSAVVALIIMVVMFFFPQFTIVLFIYFEYKPRSSFSCDAWVSESESERVSVCIANHVIIQCGQKKPATFIAFLINLFTFPLNCINGYENDVHSLQFAFCTSANWLKLCMS